MKSNIFQISKSKTNLSIALSSTMDNIDKIDAETRTLLTNELSDSQIFGLCLSMREGLTNAIKHGHGSDPTKMIQYTLRVKEDRICIAIEDQGKGFDWKTICRNTPQPELDHGRGLMIIREYSSEYYYNEKGNKLTIIMHKSKS